MQRVEYEDFYEIESDNFNLLIKELLNNKYLSFDDYNFCIENPSKKTELQLLSVNINEPDERERIKIRYKNLSFKFLYEKKKFKIKHRQENTVKLSGINDVCVLTRKTAFKAAIIKTSLKWPCVDYIKGKKFYMKAQICCPVNTKNFDELSDPLFYFEIESTNSQDLDLFYKTDIYTTIKPYLSKLEFETANKYRKCIKVYSESAICFNSEKDALYKLRSIFEIFTNKKFENTYFGKSEMHIRGNNESKLHLEKGKCVEKEIKFIPKLNNEEYIHGINKLLCEQFHIIKASPRIVFDLYYDTNDDSLYKNNCCFRFRCRRKGSGWVACFKSNAVECNGVLLRNNIRTNMTKEDIIMKNNVGETIQMLLNDTAKFFSNFSPSILIVQKRERFAVRPNNIKLITNDEKEKDITYFNQRSELVHIIFDEMQIYDAKNIDILSLLSSQEIISTNYNCIRFKTAEIEANERNDIEDVSKIIFEKISSYLDKINVNTLNMSKYMLAKELLNENTIFTGF